MTTLEKAMSRWNKLVEYADKTIEARNRYGWDYLKWPPVEAAMLLEYSRFMGVSEDSYKVKALVRLAGKDVA